LGWVGDAERAAIAKYADIVPRSIALVFVAQGVDNFVANVDALQSFLGGSITKLGPTLAGVFVVIQTTVLQDFDKFELHGNLVEAEDDELSAMVREGDAVELMKARQKLCEGLAHLEGDLATGVVKTYLLEQQASEVSAIMAGARCAYAHGFDVVYMLPPAEVALVRAIDLELSLAQYFEAQQLCSSPVVLLDGNHLLMWTGLFKYMDERVHYNPGRFASAVLSKIGVATEDLEVPLLVYTSGHKEAKPWASWQQMLVWNDAATPSAVLVSRVWCNALRFYSTAKQQVKLAPDVKDHGGLETARRTWRHVIRQMVGPPCGPVLARGDQPPASAQREVQLGASAPGCLKLEVQVRKEGKHQMSLDSFAKAGGGKPSKSAKRKARYATYGHTRAQTAMFEREDRGYDYAPRD
jgi:hypothetical protein